MKRIKLANYKAASFGYSVSGKVATITLNRPERKNPLTLESYGELRDLFREMTYASDVKAVVITGAGGNFCSGGDVHDIIGKLVKMDMPGLMRFTRMTGDLVKDMRGCHRRRVHRSRLHAGVRCRPAFRPRPKQARFSFRARRLGRRRHGRVHLAAAPDRLFPGRPFPLPPARRGG